MDIQEEQCRYEREGQSKGDIPQETQLLPFFWRPFVGQQVQNHCCPAGIAAPAPSKEHRAENLCHGVVNGCCLEYAGEQVIPEALDLHVFIADEAQIDQHIQPDQQLRYASCMAVFVFKQSKANGNGYAYIAEIEQIKQVVHCQPKGNGNGLKHKKHHKGSGVFFKYFHDFSILRGERLPSD